MKNKKEEKKTEMASVRIPRDVWQKFKSICAENGKTLGGYLTEIILGLYVCEAEKRRLRTNALRRKYHGDYYDEFEAMCREQHIDPDDLRVFLSCDEDNNQLNLDEDDIRHMFDGDDEI